MTVSKSDICFIRPRIDKNDYYYKAIKKMGYDIEVPYVGNWFCFRIFRELWFRFSFPKRHVWYNNRIKHKQSKLFIVRDSLITNDFLEWLREYHPESRIILDYDNLASTTLNPDTILDNTIEKWSYDEDDCKRYGMKMKPMSFLDIYSIKKNEPSEYDVLYLGRDKGRMSYLLELEKELKGLGLKTHFHICANRRYELFKNRNYKHLITYDEYIELMRKSRSIMNIVDKPQSSMTMRDMEVVFNGIKGITNNRMAINFPLYDPSRYFILGVDPIDSLKSFLNTPFLPLKEHELDPFRYENAIRYMIER